MKAVELLARQDPAHVGECWQLASPSPGVFRRTTHVASWLAAGDVLGQLEILGRVHDLVVPHGVAGGVASVLELGPVGYGETLAVIDRAQGNLASRPPDDPIAAAAAAATGLVFRAPTSGRYYGRSAPDKPPFVTVGAELATGTTVCLLEVMKTFNRVAYQGDRVRVRDVLVAEGADVNAGDPLLALEAL